MTGAASRDNHVDVTQPGPLGGREPPDPARHPLQHLAPADVERSRRRVETVPVDDDRLERADVTEALGMVA